MKQKVINKLNGFGLNEVSELCSNFKDEGTVHFIIFSTLLVFVSNKTIQSKVLFYISIIILLSLQFCNTYDKVQIDAKKIQETLIRVMHQTQKMVAVEAIVKGGWKRGLLGRDKGHFGIDLLVNLNKLKKQMEETLSDKSEHNSPE